MLDMDRRLQPIRRTALGVLAAGLLIMGPWIGWWPIVPLLVAALLFFSADCLADRVERPEFLIFGAWVGSQLVIAISVLLVWGPDVPVMSWFAIPVATLGTRFSLRGVVLGVLITISLMITIAFLTHPAEVIDQPPLLVMPLAVVITVGILTTALMRSDIEHRGEAVIDPLTAMLNRKALANRVEELSAQSSVSGAPVGVILLDIDHFKHVNDSAGHLTGDAVLRDIAYVIRKDMRAFELAYRLGGEEFLVLLPGANEIESLSLAEKLRGRIAAASLAEGIQVTVSCGVSATRPGEEFDFEALYCGADAAMYEAKRLGRNRIQGPMSDSVAVTA